MSGRTVIVATAAIDWSALRRKTLIIRWAITITTTFYVSDTDTVECITDFTGGTIPIIIATSGLLTNTFNTTEQHWTIGVGPALAYWFATALDADIARRTRIGRIALLRCATKPIETVLPRRAISVRSTFKGVYTVILDTEKIFGTIGSDDTFTDGLATTIDTGQAYLTIYIT